MKVLIGLTGNIATGKSEVGRMLAELGARVIDADAVAHQVMRRGGPAYDAVLAAFGPDILRSDGEIDRVRLGAIVFADKEALRRLEAIVHPQVIAHVDALIREASEPVVVVEAIKLIEAGMHRNCHALWVVTCPREQQIARLIRTRGLTEAEAILRVDAQSPQAEKIALADVVIDNSHTLAETRRQVETEWKKLPSTPEAPA
ncbi:MAG: dephospho-CoA kinase [Anaerolineae bacterium]|jgi:dephospho-CoA kinase|nr:dephospho-CoA kinase [Anaerolineae bacterium]MDH7475708.1 dephospho-CoA kinase [Anaerolineae bacterium]